jgi:hypothetical protein
VFIPRKAGGDSYQAVSTPDNVRSVKTHSVSEIRLLQEQHCEARARRLGSHC